ncbi:MAG: phosphoglucosamine mutase [Acidiferrobacteraceae bacterium]|jgi:phosphoglucosamine mutase
MNKRFFGTDGIRGRVGEEPITPETVLKLGWAAGQVLGGADLRVVIGKDTRVSGYLLESAMEAGLSAAGADIRLLGPMPTPGIAYLTRTFRAHAGVVISASHNPYYDNGIKFFSEQGTKLPDEVEAAIEERMSQRLVIQPSQRLGKVRRHSDAAGRYIEFCKSTFPNRLNLDGLKIVVDCAHGAAYQIAPHVFSELGAHVIAIANEPDGFNINLECGSIYPQTLQAAVREHEADLGLALDGDGDRVIMVDHEGRCVDGDQILYIIAAARSVGRTLHGGVVGTQMSNFGLEQALKRLSISFRRSAVGDRYVLAMMQQEGWELGGESSGHIICLDKSTTGDGIIAALQVLAVVVESNRGLAELCSDMPVYPQRTINVPLAGDHFDVGANAQVADARRAAEAQLHADGRVVLRASGTEPVVRVTVEGRDTAEVSRLCEQLAETVRLAAAGRTA